MALQILRPPPTTTTTTTTTTEQTNNRNDNDATNERQNSNWHWKHYHEPYEFGRKIPHFGDYSSSFGANSTNDSQTPELLELNSYDATTITSGDNNNNNRKTLDAIKKFNQLLDKQHRRQQSNFDAPLRNWTPFKHYDHLAQLSCDSGEMILRLNFSEPFRGIVYPDNNRLSPCRFFGDGHLNYELRLPLRGCGTRQAAPRVFINDVIVRFHKALELEEDESKTLICRYPPPLASATGVQQTGAGSGQVDSEVVASTVVPPLRATSAGSDNMNDTRDGQFELIEPTGSGGGSISSSEIETLSANLLVPPATGPLRPPDGLLGVGGATSGQGDTTTNEGSRPSGRLREPPQQVHQGQSNSVDSYRSRVGVGGPSAPLLEVAGSFGGPGAGLAPPGEPSSGAPGGAPVDGLLSRLSSVELLFMVSSLLFLVLLALGMAASYLCLRRYESSAVASSRRRRLAGLVSRTKPALRASAILRRRAEVRRPRDFGPAGQSAAVLISAAHRNAAAAQLQRQRHAYLASDPFGQPAAGGGHSPQHPQHPQHPQQPQQQYLGPPSVSSPESELSGRGLLAGGRAAARADLYAPLASAGYGAYPRATPALHVVGRRGEAAYKLANHTLPGPSPEPTPTHYAALGRRPHAQQSHNSSSHLLPNERQLWRAKSLSSVNQPEAPLVLHHKHPALGPSSSEFYGSSALINATTMAKRHQRSNNHLHQPLRGGTLSRHEFNSAKHRDRQQYPPSTAARYILDEESRSRQMHLDGHVRSHANRNEAQLRLPRLLLKSVEDSFITNFTEVHEQEYMCRDSTRPLSLDQWKSMATKATDQAKDSRTDTPMNPNESRRYLPSDDGDSVDSDDSDTGERRRTALRSLTELNVNFAQPSLLLLPSTSASQPPSTTEDPLEQQKSISEKQKDDQEDKARDEVGDLVISPEYDLALEPSSKTSGALSPHNTVSYV